MLQAAVTLLFLAIGTIAGWGIVAMLVREWTAIRTAIAGTAGRETAPPLPPIYRAMPARRAAIMTIREVPAFRAAA